MTEKWLFVRFFSEKALSFFGLRVAVSALYGKPLVIL